MERGWENNPLQKAFIPAAEELIQKRYDEGNEDQSSYSKTNYRSSADGQSRTRKRKKWYRQRKGKLDLLNAKIKRATENDTAL